MMAVLRVRGGGETRTDLGTLLSQYGLGRVGWGASAGVPVTTLTVAGVPAVHRAVTFAAEAVAVLRPAVWTSAGLYDEMVQGTASARLFRGVPNEQQSWFDFWEAVQSSLDFRGNAYLWKERVDGRIVAIYALHPDQVAARRSSQTKQITYRCSFGEAYVTPRDAKMHATIEVGGDVMHHIRGRGGNGEIIAPSPITLFRSSLGISVAKQQHEANLYENGVQGGMLATFPERMTQQQATQWLDFFDSRNAGAQNAGRTKAIGGGATISPIGMTQTDAQFVESSALSIMDICRIFSVNPWFVFADVKAEKALSPEQEEQRWVYHGLNPRLRRIEASINADPDLFGPGSTTWFAFDTGELIHPSALTVDTIAHQQIQDGRMLVDEWRVPRGLKPLPDGLGEIPQVIPVGGSPIGVTVPTGGSDAETP